MKQRKGQQRVLKARFCDESEQRLLTPSGFYRYQMLTSAIRRVRLAGNRFIDKALRFTDDLAER